MNNKTFISSLHLYRTFLENNIRYGMCKKFKNLGTV